MSILIAENLSFAYKPALSLLGRTRKDSKKVLENINLSVNRGDVVALVGQSGSGKSTLLHMLAGYLKPDSGTITIHNTPVTKPSSRCAMMFQNDFLYPWLNIEQNITLGLKITNFSGDIKAKVNSLIDIVNLQDHRTKYPNALSGGQRQRVAFCRGLATNPDIILLDEPFSALDPMTRERLQNTMRKTIKQSQNALVFVSHSIEEVVYMADVVYAIGDGQVLNKVNIDLSPNERQNPSSRAPYKIHLSNLLKKGQNDESLSMLYDI